MCKLEEHTMQWFEFRGIAKQTLGVAEDGWYILFLSKAVVFHIAIVIVISLSQDVFCAKQYFGPDVDMKLIHALFFRF